MKDLTDYEKDIIAVQSKRLEQELWDAAAGRDEYVYKEKVTFSKLMDTYPRLMMMGLAPVTFMVVALVSEIMQ
jgi:hypothetical protein